MKRFLVTLIATYFLINLSAANKAVYNIMDYGAIADTTILSTNAIQKAIDECAKNGGGLGAKWKLFDDLSGIEK